MKLAGFLLLPAGWLILLAAVVLFPTPTPRTAFVTVGAAIEIAGLVFATHAHRAQRGAGE